MLIYGLNGSPRKNGSTAVMVREALKGAGELGAKTREVFVPEFLDSIEDPFCRACSSPCNKSCYQGTRLEELFHDLSNVDGLILGSPVFFGTVSGQLKALWDLTRALRKELHLMNVVGGALAVGHSRFGGQETTIRALQDMMMIQGMLVVGEGYGDDAGHQGAAGQSPVDGDGMDAEKARMLGSRVAAVARATKQLRIRP